MAQPLGAVQGRRKRKSETAGVPGPGMDVPPTKTSKNSTSQPASALHTPNTPTNSEKSSVFFTPPTTPRTDQDILIKRGYRLRGGKLGSGRYSKVKLASNLHGGKFAVKIIDVRNVRKEFIEKFLPREVGVWKKIRHPNIIRMEDYFEELNLRFLVLEFAPYGDLLTFIQKEGAQPEQLCHWWFNQLLSAIMYLHSHGVTHRDMKLENILIGNKNHLKITDFGFCKELHSPEEMSSTYCGSKAYSSPEILQGVAYDPMKADVWSLGVILFIIVAGVMPFNEHVPKQSQIVEAQKKRAYTYPSTLPPLTEACYQIVDWMLSFQVADRPTAREVGNHLWVRGTWMGKGGEGEGRKESGLPSLPSQLPQGHGEHQKSR